MKLLIQCIAALSLVAAFPTAQAIEMTCKYQVVNKTDATFNVALFGGNLEDYSVDNPQIGTNEVATIYLHVGATSGGKIYLGNSVGNNTYINMATYTLNYTSVISSDHCDYTLTAHTFTVDGSSSGQYYTIKQDGNTWKIIYDR